MTVAELIAELQKLPSDLKVYREITPSPIDQEEYCECIPYYVELSSVMRDKQLPVHGYRRPYEEAVYL